MPSAVSGSAVSDSGGSSNVWQGAGSDLFITSGGSLLDGAKIITDRSDYAPGSIVTITGFGFQPGETVSNQVTQVVGPAAGTNYASWEVTANTDGRFTTTWFVFGAELLDTELQLSSIGESSGLGAQKTFSDALNLTVEGGVTNDVTRSGVAGALIKVYSDAGLTTQVGSTITTTASGIWNLTLARNATFYVVVTPPASYSSSRANTGTATGSAVASIVSTAEIQVGSGPTGGDVSGAAFLVHNTSAIETTIASAASATYSTSAQNVTLAATVTSSAGTVAAGSVTFTLKNGSTVIGVAVSGPVSSGSASVTYSLPARTAAGSYTIQAVYSTAAGNADGSDSTHLLTVNKVAVTITSGISANNKVYDGTTSATLSSNNVVLAGVVAGDAANVKLSTNGYTATFASAVVGNGKTVTVSGLTLTGSAAGNYTLTQPSLSANITPRTVTVSSGLTANNKIYDGTTMATLSSNNVVLAGVVAGDTANVSLSTNGYSATFASAAVGNGKTVMVSGLTLTGSAAGNYTLTQPSLSANITPGTVSQLAFTTQSGSAAAGAAFGQQPVVQTQDAYGNDSTVGLGANLAVTVTLTSGTGPLQGTTMLDIGTSAGNGTVSFTNLRIDPAGTKQLTASANGLTPALSATFSIANVPPAAGTATFLRPRNVPLKILISDLLTNASDLNGDMLQLVGVSAASTNGAALYTNATYVLYSLPPGGNLSDSFNYTVSDGTATTSGTVLITVAPGPTGTNYNQVAYAVVNGKPTSTFAGVPSYTYKVQRTEDLTGNPTWTDLATTNAPAGGLFQFVDQNPPNGNLIYRAINQ